MYLVFNTYNTMYNTSYIWNKNVTLEIVQLLHGALHLRNDDGRLPLHFLCCNEALDETASLDILYGLC